MASKKELRKAMDARLHGLTAEEKAAASAAVCARLAALPQYRQASSIMAFLHMPDEVSLDALIKDALAAGKEVYVPVCGEKQHSDGRRRETREPAGCGAAGLRPAPPE
ncbi:5-formyltetrahydrofolate cyclo-ligase, partial [Megasphaera sp.]|uniref:5-formyltetrahydrofolate cyclo-ligase n=1 Tax=Megasphaera sp. TaxID=2023260 RepID=UPI004024EE02